MNKEFIRESFRNLMEVINEQQAQLLMHQGKIPQIEIDILKENMRKAYECLADLNKQEAALQVEPATSVKTDMLIANVESHVKEEVSDFSSTDIAHTTPEPAVADTIEEIPVIAEANVVAHVQPETIVSTVEIPVTPVINEVVTEAVLPQAAMAKERAREFTKPAAKYTATASLFDDAPTIAGQFQETKTVRDKIADAREDKSIAEKLQQHPVTDLKKSIGINEKFSFINELFDGDMDEYNAAIEQLNTAATITAAMQVLSGQLATKYNWSPDGWSYLQLKNLLERRYSS